MTAEKDVLAGHAVLDPATGLFVELLGEGKAHLGSRVNAERTAELTEGRTLEVVAVTVPARYGGKRALPPKRNDGGR